MRTKDLADWLGVSSPTLRHWTRNEFKAYFTHAAQGGSGRTRNFGDFDARLAAFIASLRNDGIGIQEIHSTLQQLQKEGWQDLPPMPAAPPGVGPVPMTPVSTAETAVATQRAALLRELAIATERIDTLADQLTDERTAHDTTRQQYTKALAEAAELRGQLATLERSTDRERRLLLRGLIALAVVAAVLLAVVVLLALTGAAG